METMEFYGSSAGVGQLLTNAYQASGLPAATIVGQYNRVTLEFRTTGTMPTRIEWRLERSDDGGVTWTPEEAIIHWSGTVTHSRMVSTRPGTSRICVELPSGCVRILVRRNGGGPDTRLLATATFDRVDPPAARGAGSRSAAARRDLWGRLIPDPEAPSSRTTFVRPERRYS